MLQQQCLQSPGWTRKHPRNCVVGDFSRGPLCSRGSNGSSRRSSSCRASAAPAAPDAAQIYSSEGDLESYVGPVTSIRLRGVGLALEASKTLQAGETLLISKPVAVVPRSDEAAAALAEEAASASSSGNWVIPLDEEIEAVAAAIGNAGSRTQAWLTFLDDGSLEHAQSTAMPDLQALAHSSNSSSSSNSNSSNSTSPAGQQDEDRLLDIADINTRVLVEDDRLTADADAEPQILTGIWPEAALMQHSCSPNTTVLVHKSCAIVTSSRSIPKEAGVFQNVLGPEVFTPLTHRQGLLSNLLSDKCSCPRCRDEAKQDPKLLQLVDDIFEACVEQVQADLQLAVEVDNEEAVENLRNQLAAYCEVVDAGFSKLGVKQQSQIWLQASLFRLYELTAIASAAVGEPQPQLVELLAALAAEVSPGSSEHLFWAQQFRTILAEDEDAPFDGSLASADKRCMTAFQLRYGRSISRELYTRLLLAGTQAAGDGDDDDDGEVEVEFMFEGSS